MLLNLGHKLKYLSNHVDTHKQKINKYKYIERERERGGEK
jgi:hypothetical protein